MRNLSISIPSNRRKIAKRRGLPSIIENAGRALETVFGDHYGASRPILLRLGLINWP